MYPDATHRETVESGGGRVRGRGSAENPTGRFEKLSLDVLPVGGGADDLLFEEPDPDGRRVPTRVFRDRARTLINPVDSPDLPFKWSINPYRGCEHGCIYCYARPTHETFGLSSGLDFESRIFAKLDAPELLRRELAHPRWTGEPIAMSGITDPYQPVERRLGITRGILEVMSQCGQAVSIVTKSALVLRDADLLASMASRGAVRVAISLTTLDPALSAIMEPRAASPAQRLRAMRELSSAGVPVAVMTAPIIPGLNDREIPALLAAAARAGARGAGMVLLRLPWQVKDLFIAWLARELPEKAAGIEARVRATRGGALTDPRFSTRMTGEGPLAEQIAQTFDIFARRVGMNNERWRLSTQHFSAPMNWRDASGQMGLFDERGPGR